MRAYVGTSGYAYKQWKGRFYPEDLPAGKMLAYYAGRLNTVEINNTFHRMPTGKLVRGWEQAVPDDFSMVLKASRRITHRKLFDETGEALSHLQRAAAALGSKLGPLLFQFPPYLKKDVERLQAFLDLRPGPWRAGFEFRHDSWFDEKVYDVLRERNVALVVSEAGKDDHVPIMPTADYGYLRLRRDDYNAPLLTDWARRVGQQDWGAVYAFFKHEDDGAAPRFAAAFRELLAAEGAR